MAAYGELGIGDELQPDLIRGLLLNTADGVCVMDSDMRIRLWNPAAELITGYAASEVIGARCSNGLLVHVNGMGQPLCGRGCPVESALASRSGGETVAYLRHRRGHRIPVRIRTAFLSAESGEPMVMEVFSDMSGKPLVASRVRELQEEAMRDPLTGLPNRRALEDRLDSAAADRRRHGIGYGVILMDLDGMKGINDSWGHPVGDMALQVLADTLSSSSRDTDSWGRWGGDEFLGLVRFAEPDDIAMVGRRMVGLVCSSAVLSKSEEIGISVSAGGTVAEAEEGPKEVVARADRLLYRSKAAGGGRITLPQRGPVESSPVSRLDDPPG